jgi:hypothetical protein
MTSNENIVKGGMLTIEPRLAVKASCFSICQRISPSNTTWALTVPG